METAWPAFVRLLDHANTLKLLPRSGWLLAGVTEVESVAEHTGTAALLALFLAEAVNRDPSAEGLCAPLDLARVASLALIHDLAESVLTDLPRRSALLLGVRAKREAEERIMGELLAEVPNGFYYLALWRDYAAGATPEARLVKDADTLEMVHQARRYARRGCTMLEEFWQPQAWHYTASAALFAALCGEEGG